MPTTSEETAAPEHAVGEDATGEGPRRPAPPAPVGPRLLPGLVGAALLVACWLCGGGPDLPDGGPAGLPVTGDAAAVGRPVAHASAPHPRTPVGRGAVPQHD
ncbi:MULTISPECIES: hypothetical protein [unclassified Streptomyces]|uniref:hypothetical protein n=1 Tax=unclassified Streptomyces TaxID=2593676 RepID=UPI00131A2C52|nr:MULTISPECIES: hypothetical protein [unclassified Streptomyces]MYT30569.1 hypothetical protein [Streptomyces sp. SID8354]